MLFYDAPMNTHPICPPVLFLLLLTLVGCHAQTQTTSTEPIQLHNNPPKVLIIGDSISMAYHSTVVAELKGVADVSRIPGNGQWTGTGVKKIDQWLGETQWDVIHFNWGLWDMYGWEYYDQDRSPEAYERRLDQLVVRLKQSGATLIWAITTPPCPENEVSMVKRFNGDGVVTTKTERRYLDAAARVMAKHGVKVNDLNALVRDDLATLQTGPDNVHFTAEGSALLGRQVAATIRETLGVE